MTRRALLPVGVFFALAACNLALGLDDKKDRLPDGGADAGAIADVVTEQPRARGDGGATSCSGAEGSGLTDCGPNLNESCCDTREVIGGEYARSNSATYPAKVSSFYLDRFEVTVGRFRTFVAASSGWVPPAGSGKHVHLNDGQGLAALSGGFEAGWRSDWNDQVPTSKAKWDEDLLCESANRTWTSEPGDAATGSDALPITCLSWYEAYAFCIWDGGFLPSETEWDYAAVGGNEQRRYPWGSPPDADCSFANYSECANGGAKRAGFFPSKADGRWGQADLGGNITEWTLDTYGSPYVNPCTDCVNIDSPSQRVYRGGDFSSAKSWVQGSARRWTLPLLNVGYVGFRCARPL